MIDPTLGRTEEEVEDWLRVLWGRLPIDNAILEGRLDEGDRDQHIDRLDAEFTLARDLGRMADLHALGNFALLAQADGHSLRALGPFAQTLYASLWGLGEGPPTQLPPLQEGMFDWSARFPPLQVLVIDQIPTFTRIVAWLGRKEAVHVPLELSPTPHRALG